MLTSVLAFFAGPLGKVVGYGALAATLLGGAAFVMHDYNAMVRAQDKVSAQAAQMAEMQSDTLHIVGGLNMAAASASTRATRNAAIVGAINAAQPSNCPVPASIRAVMDGLRTPGANGAGSAPASP